MIKVLFICHGNICRSPMCEFMMKDLVKKLNREEEFYIASAATSTEEICGGVGNPVYPPARAELKKHGISCEGKRAVQVTKADYDKYDYLICADSNNVRNLMRIIGSDPEGKVSLLLDFTDRKGASIADPWYTDNFVKTYEDIREGLDGFINYLDNLDRLDVVSDISNIQLVYGPPPFDPGSRIIDSNGTSSC